MLFNSIEFLIFFLAVYILYWIGLKNSLKLQNLLLLVGSYVFYGWSDWRLLSYLIASSAITFFLGIYIEKSANTKHKQWLVYAGMLQGIGGLIFFKYFNFFIISFKEAFHHFGINLNVSTLKLLIPIGISFFTFKTISYLLDVNKGKIEATKDWIVFFTYVAFFPTILSGPIDKARNFIPQLEKPREFDYEKSMEGFKQILWGLFKKVVIANSLGTFVNEVYSNYSSSNSYTLLLASIAYSFQIYTDFSGYSDMAIGLGRLLGFEVTTNFNYPFFAENIAEFWRKWHISLTSWLTEYVFTPLSILFRDYGKFGVIISIIINFIICGIWHGANWTFVLWGFLHGCYFIPLILKGKFNKKKKITKENSFPSFKQILNMLGTFALITFTLVLFRSNTFIDAIAFYKQFILGTVNNPKQYLLKPPRGFIFYYILPLIIIEWHFKINNLFLSFKNIYLNRIFYFIIGLLIFLYIGQQESYIYFKF